MVRIAACLKKAGVEPIVALKCVIVALIGGVLALFALLVLRFGPLWPCVCAVVLAVAAWKLALAPPHIPGPFNRSLVGCRPFMPCNARDLVMHERAHIMSHHLSIYLNSTISTDLTLPRTQRRLRCDVISDTHNKHRSLRIPDGDVLLHCGDFTNSGRIAEIVDFNSWLGQSATQSVTHPVVRHSLAHSLVLCESEKLARPVGSESNNQSVAQSFSITYVDTLSCACRLCWCW